MKTLLDQYKFSFKVIGVSMPILSAAMILTGIIISIVMREVFWVGLIITAIGLLTILEFFLIRKYLVKKIAQLQQKQEGNTNDQA